MVVFIFSFRAQKLLGSGMRKERKKRGKVGIFMRRKVYEL